MTITRFSILATLAALLFGTVPEATAQSGRQCNTPSGRCDDPHSPTAPSQFTQQECANLIAVYLQLLKMVQADSGTAGSGTAGSGNNLAAHAFYATEARTLASQGNCEMRPYFQAFMLNLPRR